MNESHPADEADPDPYEQPQDINDDPKAGKIGSQFEKNYPKNIFIPIVEYLG